MPLSWDELENAPAEEQAQPTLAEGAPAAAAAPPPLTWDTLPSVPEEPSSGVVTLTGKETTIPPGGDKPIYIDLAAEAFAQFLQAKAGLASVVREPLKIGRLVRPLIEKEMVDWETLYGEPPPEPLQAVGSQLSAYGDSVSDLGKKLTSLGILPEAPPPTTLGQKVASGVGQAGGFAIGGVLGGTFKAAAATQAILGAASMAGSNVEETQAMGASPEDQLFSAMANAALGTTDAIPGVYWLKRLNKASGGKLFQTLKNVPLDTGPGAIRGAITGAAAEFAQEFGQTYGENKVAADIVGYDPDRPLDQGVWDAAKVGGIVGAIFGGGTGAQAHGERRAQAKELDRIRDEAINSLDPINSIGSSTAPFMPLGAPSEEFADRPDIQAKIGQIDEFLNMKGDDAINALFTNMQETLPGKFVVPDEQTTLGGRATPTQLRHELERTLDSEWHKDDQHLDVLNAIHKGKSRVILAHSQEDPMVRMLGSDVKQLGDAIAEYDRLREDGTLPAEMSDMEKSDRSDYASRKEDLAKWQKLDEGKRRWMRHIADYVDRFAKAFDQVPGANTGKIAVFQAKETSFSQDASGLFMPAEDVQLQDGSTQPYDMLTFNLDKMLHLRSPEDAKDFTKRDALELFESVNHELGHWLSYRYFQSAAQKYNDGDFADQSPEGRQRMKEFAAIVQDYARWYKEELKTPLGTFLGKQRGVALGQQIQRLAEEGQYPGTSVDTPVETAFGLSTAVGRLTGKANDRSGRDYFFNFPEYMAHRMERMAARPGDNKVTNELGETIEPGFFKTYFEAYEKVFSDLKSGAAGKDLQDAVPHVWDQFIRRLSLKNRLIEDAKLREKMAPVTLADGLKGKIPGFDTTKWGGLQHHYDKFTKHVARYFNLGQWAELNPHVQGLQTYNNIVGNLWQSDIREIYHREHHTLLAWRRLGKESANRVSNVQLEEAEQEERYTPQEIQARLTEAEAEVYYTVRRDYDDMLEGMRKLALREAQRGLISNSEMLAAEMASINATFDEMKAKAYTPYLRFGENVVVVRAAKDVTYEGKDYKQGQTISWEAFDYEWEQDRARAEWQAKGGTDFHVGKTLMNDQMFATQAMPLPMLKMLRDNMPLNAQGEMDEAIKNALPAGSFKKRFLKKKGVKGFSQDLQRSYATYMRSAAGHMARVTWAEEMLDAIRQVGQDAINIANMGEDATQRARMHQAMQKHYEYIMNPGNEWQSLRAGGFLFNLGLNVKSALVNLLQIPQVGYPHLSARFGDVKATAALAGAMKDNVSYWKNRDSWLRSAASTEERKLSYAIRRGPLNKEGGTFFAIDWGSKFFKEAVGIVEGASITQAGQVPTPKFYDLSKAKILDLGNVDNAVKLLDTAIEIEKSEMMPSQGRIEDLEQLKAFIIKEGYGVISHDQFRDLRLAQTLQPLGYDGATMLEDDDVGYATSAVYMRDIRKVKEISHREFKKRKEAKPSERKGEIVRMIQYLQQIGTLDQSLAMEAAIASSESRADRLMPINKAELLYYKSAEYAALPFHVAEKLNRQIMAMATYNLWRDSGHSEQRSIVEARNTVRKTMYEHSQWNRPEFMRGKKSIFFLFYNYIQHTAYFATRGDAAAMRYWLMLGLFAGAFGLPFAEDLEDLIDFTVTRLNQNILKSKNPKFQLRQEMRRVAEQMNMNPDLLTHGFAQNSFGLPALFEWAGIPGFPSFDLSGSVGLGDIIPGTGIPQGLMEDDFERAMTSGAEDIGGAFVSNTMGIVRAAFSDDPNVWKRSEGLMPAFAKSASKAGRYWTQGAEKTASGQLVADFDPFEPKDQMEIAGQALGFTPSRVTRGWERIMAERELVNYYELQKRKTMKQFYHAVWTEDREAIKDAQEGVSEYSRTVPFPEMAITGKALREGARAYAESQMKNEKGISGRKTYRLEQSVRALYPAEPAAGTVDMAPTG